MSNTSTTSETSAASDILIQWGPTAPKGVKAVLNRLLKRDGKVPMFFGQTLIKSLRDQGYSTTTSALCEFVDNSFQRGANEVRVYIVHGKKDKIFRILVVDNGPGMPPTSQQVAMSFGASLAYECRRLNVLLRDFGGDNSAFDLHGCRKRAKNLDRNLGRTD